MNLKMKVILISFFCSFLPLFLLGAMNFFTIHNLLLEKEEAKLLALSTNLETIVNNYFKDSQKDLFYLANMQDTKQLLSGNGNYSQINNNLLYFLLNNEKYDQVLIVNLEGDEIVKVDNQKYPSIVPRKQLGQIILTNLEQNLSFVEPYEHKALYLLNEQGSLGSIRYITAVTDMYGIKKGYIILDTKVNSLRKNLNQLQKSFLNIYLANNNGSYIFHPQISNENLNGRSIKKDFAQNYNLILNAKSHQSFSDGNNVIFIYPFKILALENEQFFLIMKIEGNIFQKPLDFFYENFVFFVAGMLFLIFFLSIKFANKITEPLIKLSSAMEKVAEGDFNQQIKVKFRETEIQSLISHFNEMIERLNLLYENLEEKVQERTQELSQATEELTRLAITDPLTGLYNRHFFQAYIHQQAEICRRYDNKIVLIVADVDNFKLINDQYGHNTGDKILKVLSSLFNESKRASDIVIRYGGDEFLIILLNGSEEIFYMWRQRFLDSLQKWNSENDIIDCKLSLSLGFAIFDGSKTIENVIKEADANMYKEKKKRVE